MSLNTILATTPLTSTNYVLKATGTTIGNSLIFDNGTNVGIGNTNTSYTLDVSGSLRNTTSAYFATTSGSVGIGTTSPSSWGTNLVVYNNQLTITGGGYDGSFADSIFFGGNSEGTNYRNKISNSLSSNVVNQKMKFSIASGATTFVDVMTLVGNGNVGIGTSSPSQRLTIVGSSTLGTFAVGTDTTHQLLIGADSSYAEIQAITQGVGFNKNLMLQRQGGQVFVGTTLGLGGRMVVNNNASAGIDIFDGSNAGGFIRFFNNGASPIGSIVTTNGFSTTYNSTSDYRLKEDLKELNGLDKVLAIKIYNYKWKTIEERMDGVLAHELAEILPYAVTGEKDGEQMQGVDYSKIVPVLVKAIQEMSTKSEEQQALITSLQSQINAIVATK